MFVYGVDGLSKNFEPYQGQHLEALKAGLGQAEVRYPAIRLEPPKDIDAYLATLGRDDILLSAETHKASRDRGRRGRSRHRESQDFEGLTGALARMGEELEEALSQQEWEASLWQPPHQPIRLSPPAFLRTSVRRAEEREQNGHSEPRELTQEEELAHAMIAYSPNEQATLRVVREMLPFGLRSLYRLFTFGLRVVVLEKGRPYGSISIGERRLTSDEKRKVETTLGIYFRAYKLILMHEDRLGDDDDSTLRHELAHAWECTYNFRKRRAGANISIELWNRFAKTRRGFVSAYAATQPVEYFAESVEAYFSEKNRARLRRLDPDMFAWLEKNLHA